MYKLNIELAKHKIDLIKIENDMIVSLGTKLLKTSEYHDKAFVLFVYTLKEDHSLNNLLTIAFVQLIETCSHSESKDYHKFMQKLNKELLKLKRDLVKIELDTNFPTFIN